MPKIDALFQRQCVENKTSDFAVIVTVSSEYDRLESCPIDPLKLQPFEDIPGLFKAVLSGNEILELYQCSEVESVDQDQEFNIFN